MSGQQYINDYVRKCMKEYGSYTLQDRAIPELKDGLKPIHRRLVWTAYTEGYTSDKPTKKGAKIVGDCLGNYSPNGDMPVYGALITLANNANPLFIKQGNFGCKATGDSEAAMRYVEAKLSKVAENYLLDKDYIAVTPMVPNYDGTKQEPVYLPAKLPIILTQGIEGIATGASTIIPSFNLESVKKLTLSALKKGKCTAKQCLNILKFEFGEGGQVIATDEELLNFYKTGEGKLFTTPTWEYDKRNHAIVLTSYSPRFKVDKAFEQGIQIKGVADVEDSSDVKHGVRLNFILNKTANPDEVAQKIIKTVGCYIPYSIMVTDRKDNGEDTTFKYTSIPEIIDDWIAWRLDFEIKVVNRLLTIEEEKIRKWEWLIWAIDNLKLIFRALRTDNPDEYLIENGDITEEHARYILDQQTRRLSKLSGEDLENKIKEAKRTIKSLRKDISSTDNISERIIDGLEAIRD